MGRMQLQSTTRDTRRQTRDEGHFLLSCVSFPLSVIGLISGCNGPRVTVAVPPPRAGVTVRVAAPDGPPRLLIERLGRAWAGGAGAQLEIVAPAGEWPAADLVLILAPDLPRWVAAGKATPLPHQEAVDAFMPLYRGRLLTW